jgi:hypothetical protein
MQNSSKKNPEPCKEYCLVDLNTHVILKREVSTPRRIATLNSVLSRQLKQFEWIVSSALPFDYSERAES